MASNTTLKHAGSSWPFGLRPRRRIPPPIELAATYRDPLSLLELDAEVHVGNRALAEDGQDSDGLVVHPVQEKGPADWRALSLAELRICYRSVLTMSAAFCEKNRCHVPSCSIALKGQLPP